MKILMVARPQFIKAAGVSRVLQTIPGVKEVLLHTGQHYGQNMSDVFFEELEIPKPDHHLGLVQVGTALRQGERWRRLKKFF